MTAALPANRQPLLHARLLVIEADPALGKTLQVRYAHAAACTVTGSFDEARRQLHSEPRPDVVVATTRLPDGDVDTLRAHSGGETEWILLAADPDEHAAIHNVFAVLEKPVDLAQLDLLVASASRSARAQRLLKAVTKPAAQRYQPDAFLGRSAAAAETRQILKQLCSAPHAALFIGGELGTGKRLVARIVHFGGPRAQGPLLEMRCNALPRDRLEAALFGREAGGDGTEPGLLAQAHGGSLFLDEVAALPLDVQARLLRFIETRKIRPAGGDRTITADVQVIATSNRDLLAGQRMGHFREDLLHRLSHYRLQLPTLRARSEDIEDLVGHFITKFNAKFGRKITQVPDPVWEKLRTHPWRGNAHELRNSVEHAVLHAQSTTLSLAGLRLQPGFQEYRDDPAYEDRSVQLEPNGRWLRLSLDGSLSLEEIDRAAIEAVLEQHHHNVAAAARSLNTTRDTLRYRIRKYGISVDD